MKSFYSSGSRVRYGCVQACIALILSQVVSSSFFLGFFFFFWSGILVPQPGIESTPPSSETEY